MNRLRRSVVFLALACAAPVVHAQPREGRVFSSSGFERIALEGAVDVRLVQGERDEVLLPAGSEESLQVMMAGSRLVIHSSGNWKFWSSARQEVQVQVRQLRELLISGASNVHAAGAFRAEQLSVNISGSGLVRFDELQTTTLRLHISGAGDGQLAGKAEELRLMVSGKGKVQAEQLRVGKASVLISGVGNAQLWVTDTLKLNVSGVGSIDYWGEPKVSRFTSGLASVNARGDKR